MAWPQTGVVQQYLIKNYITIVNKSFHIQSTSLNPLFNPPLFFLFNFPNHFMMSIRHRKLLFSQINFHRNTRVLLVKEIVRCSCFLYCPPDCTNSSENDQSSPPPPPPPPQIPKNDMPTILILMLSVLGAAFIFLCYLTILKRYRTNMSNSRRRFSSSAADEEFLDENNGRREVDHHIWYIHTVGLPQSVIDSIAVFKYKKGEGLIEGTDCSVCLSEFEDDESLRLLPKCSHAFHITCIDTWLRSHKNCPLCRAPVVRDTNVSSTDTPQADLLESGLSNSGSREDNSGDDRQLENDAVGEDRTSELRIGAENNGQLSNEEDKILEMLRRNSNNFTSGKNKIRVLSDLADHRVRLGEELQPAVRRSFSMDLPSASMIYAAVAKMHPVKDEGCSKIQDLEVKKQNLEIVAAKQEGKTSSIHRSRKSFSFGRSLQSVPILMKRSFSSSGKSSIHRHSRSQELVQRP